MLYAKLMSAMCITHCHVLQEEFCARNSGVVLLSDDEIKESQTDDLRCIRVLNADTPAAQLAIAYLCDCVGSCVITRCVTCPSYFE